MDITTKKIIEEKGWQIDEVFFDRLSAYQQEFTLLELIQNPRSFTYYQERLKLLGFQDCEKILDAACGIGQWTLALASLNEFVYGLDVSKERIDFAKEFAKSNQVKNSEFLLHSIETTPYADAYFDRIFCYSAFMFTNMPLCLQEFNRILKKGGQVYLNADTYGWYLHMILDRGIKGKQFGTIREVLMFFAHFLYKYKSNIAVTRSFLKKLAKNSGFRVVEFGAEGQIRNHDFKLPALYQSTYYGYESIVEVVLEKI